MTPFLTLDEVDLKGQNVLLRLDLNMPFEGDRVVDDSRLQASRKTLEMLHDSGARTVIVTHIGRPKGEDPSLSTVKLLPSLEKLLGKNMFFAKTLSEAKEKLKDCADGDFILLENIRFWLGEEKNDEAFCKELATLANIYVNEAFSVSHRKHASVYGAPLEIPIRVAGYQLLEEVEHIHALTQNPKRLVLSVIGGSKVSTKLTLLRSILSFSDLVIVGGAMANTFLVALGRVKPGASFYEESMVEEAITLHAQFFEKLFLPLDAVVTDSLDNPQTTMHLDIVNIPSKYQMVDIGPKTIAMIEDKAAMASTILWNGPVGVFEKPPFDKGSRAIAEILGKRAQEGAVTIAGGGDTLACLGRAKDKITFVSTAGGAFLEALEGEELVGVKILYKNFGHEPKARTAQACPK